MRIATSLVMIAFATSPAWAEPTQVFPLTGADLPPERRGMTERLTRAIADSIDGEVSSVAIEDAAGLLECDVEATSCLELVSKSVGNKQLVFGTVVQGAGSVLKVTLTRFRPGPDRQQQTYEITGATEAYPDELVRKAAPLFGGTAPARALWFKTLGQEDWFYYYLPGIICISLIICIIMRDTRYDSAMHRHE